MKPRPYNLVLLSAEKSDQNDYKNAKCTATLYAVLDTLGLDYQPAEGQYQGRPEASAAVKLYAPIAKDLNTLKQLAFNIFKQDSILVVGVDDKVRLLFNDGNEPALGDWVELAGPHHAKDWTRIGVRTFTTEKHN